MPVNFVLLFTAIGVGIVFLLLTLKMQNLPKHLDVATIIMLLLVVVLSAIGNWSQFSATKIAPNPGMVIAIVSTQAGLLAILSAIFLRSKMNPIQIIGLLIVMTGVVTLSIGSTKNQETTSKNQVQESIKS